MTDSQTSPSSKTPLWQKLLLILGGIVFAYVLVWLGINFIPGLMPEDDDRVRSEAGTTLNVEFYFNDGDLFAWLPGRIRPPDENVLVASYSISWDEEGFRVPQMTAEHYPIAVFGDSFTEGPNVAVPWPDLLAASLGIPVRNYGYRAYGPRELADVAQEFAGEDERSWVLYAHFSGNDIAQSIAPESHMIQERTPLQLIPFLVDRASRNTAVETEPDPNAQYDFPMPVIIGASYYDLVILDSYLWWQIAPEGGYDDTLPFQIIGNTLDTFTESVSPDTCKAVVFIPVKGQIYYQYIHEDVRRYMRQLAQRPVVMEDDRLELSPYASGADNEDELMAHFTDQRDAMARLAEAKGWYFIDLLPAFQETAAQGELLYYRYDTHWNQAGHDLAAKVISEAMRDIPECPLTVE